MKVALVKHLSHDYHPLIDGLLEMVIKSHGPLLSLKILLRCLVSENLKAWDSVLSTAEFAYNNSVNRTTDMNPFEIVTSYIPRTPINFIPMSVSHHLSEPVYAFVLHIHSLYQEIGHRIAMSNGRYKQSADLHRSHREF